jgi:hypothetical protein
MQHPMEAVHGDTIIIDKSDEEYDRDLAEMIVKKSNELKDDTIDMALRVLAAHESLDWSIHHIKKSWVEWQKEAHDALEQLRQLRFALTTEAKTVLATAKDVRNFFLDNKHVEEMQQLKDFVEVVERLSVLEKNGTLDALVDVVLRLAEGQSKA